MRVQTKQLRLGMQTTSARRMTDPPRHTNGNGVLPTWGYIDKDRLTNPLHSPPTGWWADWTTTYVLPIPFVPSRRIRLVLPIPPGVAGVLRKRTLRPRALVLLLVAVVVVFFNVRMIWRRVNRTGNEPGWGATVRESITGHESTLVFGLDELREVYEWEIKSGNYPTRRRSKDLVSTCTFGR